MGVLQRFERRLEGLVTGTFARAFKAEVQPVEIAAALQRELDNTATILSRERSLVPNEFVVELSEHDHERLTPYAGTLGNELSDLVREHAAEQHYAFSGPVRVRLEEQKELPTGRFRVRSSVRAGVDRSRASQPTPTSERRAAAYLDINGTEHAVLPPGLLIGRSAECDLRIDDPGVSRRHAELRVGGEGSDAEVTVIDLGSTNGTLVDGVRISRATVSDGSRIVLGSTTAVVRRRSSRG
jgi:Protein of unknown function (DUF3662)/FHA domain